MLPEGPGTRYLGFLCDLGPLALCSPALWVLQQLEWFWAEATGADPHLSLGGYEAGGVRVLCRSAGWYPLPQLLWKDARGQHLPLVSQTHSQDQEGLFEIEGAVIVTGSVEGPLSCVVRNSHLQQETGIIPAHRSSLLPQRPALEGGSGSGPRAFGCVHWPRCLSLSKASNQAALLTTSSSAFAFQRHRAESWCNKLQR
eukprot:XP_027326341.1 butyrophilin subfamily 1 member A1 [Anas platyrhynchos]